jgi:hypothetical protein
MGSRPAICADAEVYNPLVRAGCGVKLEADVGQPRKGDIEDRDGGFSSKNRSIQLVSHAGWAEPLEDKIRRILCVISPLSKLLQSKGLRPDSAQEPGESQQ